MPTTEVITNRETPLGQLLQERLVGAVEFRAASAFLNSGGLKVVLPHIDRILRDEGSVHIVHGADGRIADPEAVRCLVNLRYEFGNFHYYIHRQVPDMQRFHPKLYVIDSEDSTDAVVGSSNLTTAGLGSNNEGNVVFQGGRLGRNVKRCHQIFSSIIGSADLIEPNRTFADRYEEIYTKSKEASDSQGHQTELQELLNELCIDEVDVRHDSWIPRNQVEVVIRALRILESDDQQQRQLDSTQTDLRTWELERIISMSKIVAKATGLSYKWDTFHNSVRRVLNSNFTDTRNRTLQGGGYFLRMPGYRSEYRLTDAGREYTGQPPTSDGLSVKPSESE